MEHFNQIKNILLAVLASLGGVLVQALGGWDITLKALVGFMAADYITGLFVAGAFHRSPKTEAGALSSRAGFLGLLRKGCILLLVLLAVLLDHAAGTGCIRGAVCLFFTANEGLSILENLGIMGVPYPAFLKNMLEALRQQADRKEQNREGRHGKQ